MLKCYKIASLRLIVNSSSCYGQNSSIEILIRINRLLKTQPFSFLLIFIFFFYIFKHLAFNYNTIQCGNIINLVLQLDGKSGWLVVSVYLYWQSQIRILFSSLRPREEAFNIYFSFLKKKKKQESQQLAPLHHMQGERGFQLMPCTGYLILDYATADLNMSSAQRETTNKANVL